MAILASGREVKGLLVRNKSPSASAVLLLAVDRAVSRVQHLRVDTPYMAFYVKL